MKLLILATILLVVYGCGTIPKSKQADFLPLKDAREIEGEYENYPDNNTKHEYQTINNIINWKANKTDTSKVLRVKINATDQTVEFVSYKLNGQINARKVKYVLKDNGFMLLKNRNFRLTGIPYILGYYDIKKIEIGLTNQKDLIINGIEESEGALLFVLGSSSPKHHFEYTFKRK